MKTIQWVACMTLLGMGLSLSACEDYSSPENTLHSAGQALFENNPSLFNRSLTGRALIEFGNLAGMERLQGLIGRTSPEIRSMTLINALKVERNVYLSTLSVDGRDGLEVKIQCDTSQIAFNNSLAASFEREPHPSSASLVIRRTCKIEDILLL